jgi:hypothetical protein
MLILSLIDYRKNDILLRIKVSAYLRIQQHMSRSRSLALILLELDKKKEWPPFTCTIFY